MYEQQVVNNKIESWAKVGHWRFDARSQEVIWSAEISRIFDFPKTFTPSLNTIIDALPLDFQPTFQMYINSAIERKECFEFTSIITSSNGFKKHVKFLGEPEVDNYSKVVAIFGLIQDITYAQKTLHREEESRLLLETASEVANIGYWRVDLIDNELVWSDETYRIHDLEPGELTPSLSFALNQYHPDDLQRVEHVVEQCIRSGNEYEFKARIVTQQGNTKYIQAKGRILEKAGKQIALFGTIQDISDQLNAMEKKEWWQYLVNETIEGIVITNEQGIIVWANHAFEKITGFKKNELIGVKPGSILQGPDTNPDTIIKLRQAIKNKEAVSVEILNYSKKGDPYWIFLSIFPRFDEHGNVMQYMAIEIDITERKNDEKKLANKQKELEFVNFKLDRQIKAAESALAREELVSLSLEKEIQKTRELQEQLKEIANKDALTGISNRRHFVKRAQSEINRAKRYGSALTICMFDIDHFKSVNDTFGHQKGDDVIRRVIEMTQTLLRVDVDLVGRLGGEEFGILFPETTLKEGEVVAERVRAAIEHQQILPSKKVTCSFGVAELSDADDLTSIMARCDEMLYLAKNSGRNCVKG
jgi:diguanylate cyclase (GGDEF)-like protein/PAS domain S-box-containing protein